MPTKLTNYKTVKQLIETYDALKQLEPDSFSENTEKTIDKLKTLVNEFDVSGKPEEYFAIDFKNSLIPTPIQFTGREEADEKENKEVEKKRKALIKKNKRLQELLSSNKK